MLINHQKFETAKKVQSSDALNSLATSATSSVGKPNLLNVGCGSTFHSDWVNLDLISESFDVIPHDLTCGLPFPDNHFDAVYHSHVLEHLKPNDGVKLLKECFRVLKRGGIARIVVPDLEGIARLYLETHRKAWDGDEKAKTDYNWMKLELLDQLVREHSGGRMGQFMTDPEIKNSDFVKSRVGNEFNVTRRRRSSDGDPGHQRNWARMNTWTQRLRTWLAKKTVRTLLGASAEAALDEGMFRHSGEVHRWMYDRFSLKDLCDKQSFVNFQILSAPISGIPNFDDYRLDVVNNEIRKPDSLFTECRKPLDFFERW